MPWKECTVMDERLQLVARRRADGGTLQGVGDSPEKPATRSSIVIRPVEPILPASRGHAHTLE